MGASKASHSAEFFFFFWGGGGGIRARSQSVSMDRSTSLYQERDLLILNYYVNFQQLLKNLELGLVGSFESREKVCYT